MMRAVAVTVSPSFAVLMWFPLTLMPTQTASGHSVAEPTPASVSANAIVAPPLRKPKGWVVRRSTCSCPMHVSSSGVEKNSMPSVASSPLSGDIFSFMRSIFITANLRIFYNKDCKRMFFFNSLNYVGDCGCRSTFAPQSSPALPMRLRQAQRAAAGNGKALVVCVETSLRVATFGTLPFS